MACDHHVIAITNRLRFQEAGELEYVGLNVLVAAKHGKAPHPIDHDTHYAAVMAMFRIRGRGPSVLRSGKGRSYVAGSGEINRRRWAEWGKHQKTCATIARESPNHTYHRACP